MKENKLYNEKSRKSSAMNDTVSFDNSTSTYYYDLESLLVSFGSIYPLDCFNFYVYLITSISGFVLSVFSFWVFMHKDQFDIAMYDYMRVKTLNSACQCFFSSFNCFYASFRLFSFSNSYWSQFYSIFIFLPICETNYYYGGVIDVLVLIDRVSFFNRSVKKWMTISPYKLCIYSLIFCIITNLPFHLTYEPGSQTFPIDANTTYTFWFSAFTAFGQTKAGFILPIMVFVLRDAVVLIVQIVVSIISTYYLKTYFKRKIAQKPPGANSHIGTAQHTASINLNEKKTSEAFALRSTVASRAPMTTNRTNNLSSADQRATLMTIILCLVSILEHVVNLLVNVYPYFYFNIVTYIFWNVANYIWVFKRVVEFFVFFGFNKNFRKMCGKPFELFK